MDLPSRLKMKRERKSSFYYIARHNRMDVIDQVLGRFKDRPWKKHFKWERYSQRDTTGSQHLRDGLPTKCIYTSRRDTDRWRRMR